MALEDAAQPVRLTGLACIVAAVTGPFTPLCLGVPTTACVAVRWESPCRHDQEKAAAVAQRCGLFFCLNVLAYVCTTGFNIRSLTNVRVSPPPRARWLRVSFVGWTDDVTEPLEDGSSCDCFLRVVSCGM